MRNALPPGIRTQMELGIRFTQWMLAQPNEPSPSRIAAAFDVSRATAYRYLESWRAAKDATTQESAR